ncbi:hypothetical protein JQ557_13150 [Bradyrhizobium sp. U87765 SZCCT0131]|uniref:hypothetical protein n=1 Tax=unclassified Bradyrhizobium TaxID=2631580 RepID=UPI001BA857C1|nr:MULTISPECIES: hypothetical protein [unclassified Bradyrhizobium]MBR1218944.1 hypothetical protein [Bradyrhizobium sp. U87765 SZCCT0131]MBR1261595.1 hypothetical protein [Bradyrhizobium sp. U87765 SZCCT0134]MBR1306552.1 hypothetical protein [Bradyrhizobium sp. U87765 SZCCT0110]MBR1317377.1 hypothetical protein [Bradyrhizobium sp. U87765 SZCCT0109]MBR1351079.1 hypothetical protein [Bradyrhizobium sp. U87765 SZCCT0048]
MRAFAKPTTPIASLPGLTRQSSFSLSRTSLVKLDHRVAALRAGPVMTQNIRKRSPQRHSGRRKAAIRNLDGSARLAAELAGPSLRDGPE